MASLQDIKDVLEDVLASSEMQKSRLLAIDKDILDLKEALKGAGGTQYSGGGQQGVLGSLGRYLGAAIGSPTPFGGIGNMIQGGGAALSAIPHPYAQAAGGITNFAGALVKGVDTIMSFSRSLLDANLKLGQFAGTMALLAAQQEMADIVYAMKLGKDTSKSTKGLQEEYNALRDELEPAQSKWTNFKNYMMQNTLFQLRSFREGGSALIHEGKLLSLDELRERLYGDAAQKRKELDEQVSLGRWTDQYSRDWAANHGRPARFQDRRAGALQRD